MRRKFSPEGMVLQDGSIDQDFFKPKKVIIQLTEDKKWGAAEKDALYKASQRAPLRPRVHARRRAAPGAGAAAGLSARRSAPRRARLRQNIPS